MIAIPDNNLEPFMDADLPAKFLSITPRRVLEMARAEEISVRRRHRSRGEGGVSRDLLVVEDN